MSGLHSLAKAAASAETSPLFVLSYLQGIDSPDKTLII